MTEIFAVSISNVYDKNKMKYLLYSSERNGFNIDVIGLNKPFSYVSKILLFKEYLEKQPIEINPIIVFTDAYDVFYLNNLKHISDKFLEFGKEIVWSVENYYSHQIGTDKQFYDNLDNKNSASYKYLNTGTFIGYKNSLLVLFKDIETSLQNTAFFSELENAGWSLESPYVDQTIISHHLVQNWHKYNIVFDYECIIFYIPVGDWDNINSFINDELILVGKGYKPCIIHVPFKSKYEPLLLDLFQRKYGTQTDTTEYTFSLNRINSRGHTICINCILFTLQDTDVKTNRYIQIFLIWLCQLIRKGGLDPDDAVFFYTDKTTFDNLNGNGVFHKLLKRLPCEMQIIVFPQPSTFSEGAMWRYNMPNYTQEIYMYCDIDILINMPLHTLIEQVEENTIYIHVEGRISDDNYGKIFTEEEKSRIAEGSPGFSNGKFIIYGKDLHIKFFNTLKYLHNSLDHSLKDSMLDQHLFNKSIYCLDNCNINTNLLAPPRISTNGVLFNKDETVLLDLMGMYGDGDFHYTKMFDMFLLLSCDGI